MVTANFQCPRHMMEVLYETNHLVSFAINLKYGLFWSAMFGSVASYIYRGWCPDVANSGSCRGKMRVIVEKASNQVSKETRRRMARECRGAGSSLVISMETPYDRTIY